MLDSGFFGNVSVPVSKIRSRIHRKCWIFAFKQQPLIGLEASSGPAAVHKSNRGARLRIRLLLKSRGTRTSTTSTSASASTSSPSTMSAAEALGLPPGVRFDPTGDELVQYYLLPRALGRPPAVPGIIIEDDTATATTSVQHPWKLLTRHRRTDDSEAYFFEMVAGTDDATKGAGAGARQGRSCGGRWTWVGQKRGPDEALTLRGDGDGDGKRVSWGKYSLNLQEGRRKGGSTGWVMHEYTVSSSQCPLLPVKLCHVSFTGHGQKRQRVPDDDGEGQELLEPQAMPPQHKRAATGSSMVTTATSTAMPNQELSEDRAQNQQQQLLFPNCDSSSIGHFWSSDAGSSQESSIVMDPPYPDCGAPLASSDLGSSQEPQAWHPLVEAEQFTLAQLFGAISSPLCLPTTPAIYHEQQQQIQPDLPVSTSQESCTTEQSHGGNTDQDDDDFFKGWPWGDLNLNNFCDTSGVQDEQDMAAQTFAAVGCRGGSSRDRQFFYQQPAL